MKRAIVTGASSGIGKECAKMLLKNNYEVFAIARDFSKCEIEDKNFIKIECDLSESKNIKKIEKEINKNNLKILINSAGVGYFGMHEDIDFEKIERIIDLNLKAPILLSKLFLKALKKNRGYIFNISSISAIKPAIFGAAYGASKAGLRHFGKSLFSEARKSGLKVININPDITKTPFFENLNFSYTDDSESYIEPFEIAKIVEDILNLREGTVITDITVEPQKFKILKKSCKNPQ